MKFFRKTKGAISVFLALIILPMYTCAGLIVDGARCYGAKTAVSGAGDLTMNAALSEYEDILQNVYGLFAMSDSTEELEKNVSRYFNNTINNTGLLQGSDSYTRSFINSIGSMFSTDEISFDNIVDTQVVSFKLVEVSDSALANPVIMERQIIEYMKYRGPVSIGKNLLTKLGCIGETSKQTKVIEKKVDYEKKLDSVEDACETAYNAINTFNQKLDSTSYKDSSYLSSLQSALASTKSNTKEMIKYQLAAQASNLSMDSMNYDQTLKNKTIIDMNKYADENEDEEKSEEQIKYDYIVNLLKNQGLEVTIQNEQAVIKNTTFYKEKINLTEPANDLKSQINYVNRVKQNYEELKKTYTYITILDECYGKLTSEEQENAFKIHSKYQYIKNTQIKNLVTKCTELKSGWKTTANVYAQAASSDLYNNWYSSLDDLEKDLDNAITALEKVNEEISNLESLGTAWENSVDDLSDSEIKTSMESDYASTAKKLNSEEINKLIEVLNSGKTQVSNIKKALESVKLNGVQICVSNNTVDRFSGIVSDEITSSNLEGKANDIMSGYADADLSGISASDIKKITEGDSEFYKYLASTFKEQASTENTEEKKTAKENKKKLIDNGNSDEAKKADTSNIKTGSYNDVITSDISKAIDDLAATSGSKDTFSPTTVDSSESDNQKVAEQNKNNLTKISNLLESLENIAENARDKVYLEEYFTEMFSCYTSGMAEDGSSVTPTSLSGYDMSTNQFYRSEVEYILWGNDNVETNLNNTKALIFGIRFALNAIFAFTSSYTRTPALTAATAIAGWTGFGVPIVQTVILLAWSMAESVIDVTNLCKGEAVCIYKSESTWVLSLNGAIQQGKKIALTTVDKVMDKLETVATDKISEISGDVTSYVNDTTDSIIESVKDTILTTIESKAQEIFRDTNCSMTRKDIRQKIDEMFAELEASASGNDVTSKAIRTAITVLDRDNITNQIYTLYTDAKKQTTDAISEKLESFLNSLVAPIKNAINSTVSSVGESLKTEVNRYIAEGGEAAKTKISDALDSYAEKIGGGSSTTGGSLASSKALSLTYKEYLKAFTLMFMLSDEVETAMLGRCAKLIQANVAAEQSSFNISKAYTMVEVNATVSVRTTFFDIPVSTGVDANGNTVYDLDYSNLGTGRQNIKYVGILSY